MKKKDRLVKTVSKTSSSERELKREILKKEEL